MYSSMRICVRKSIDKGWTEGEENSSPFLCAKEGLNGRQAPVEVIKFWENRQALQEDSS